MPSELDQAPKAEYVRDLWDWNKSHWAKQIALDTQLVDLYFDEHVVPTPDTNDPNRKNRIEPERMSTGEAARVVDTITNFFVQFASIGVMWLGKGKSPAAHDDIEIALAEIRDQLNPVIDAPRTTTVFQKVLLGRSAEIFLPGDKAWWDFPKFQQEGYEDETNEAFMEREKDWRRKAPVPIFWKALPAESTFPGSLGRIDEEVLSTVEMSWAELLRIFSREELGPLLPKERKDWNQVATLGTYANRKVVSHVVLATGENAASPKTPDRIIRSVEHKMGRCAIRILPGRTTAWKEPGRHWRSVLFPVLKLLEGLDKRMSEAATASKFSSLPVLKAKLNQSDEDNDFLDKVINGDIIELSAGGDGMPAEDIEALFMPPYGEKTIALAGFLQDRIERMTGASPAIEGSFGPSGQPAWSRSFSADLAKNFQAPLTDKIIAADIDNMEMVMRAVASFGEDIPLQRHEGKGGIVLKVEGLLDWIPKLKGDYQLSTVANEEARFDLGMSLLERADATNAPLSPEFIATKFWGIEQPLVEWKKKLVWDFIRSPELRKFQMDKLLEEADVGLAEDEGMSIEEFEQLASRVPEPARSTIRQKAGGGVNPQTQGLIQATSAFSRTGGGSKPRSQEQVT